MKTNKMLLIALLFLGLQPLAALAMSNSAPEEITELKESNEPAIIITEISRDEHGNEKEVVLEGEPSSWLSVLPTLPQLPSFGTLATQAVNTVVVKPLTGVVLNPFHAFVDSTYGITIPGVFLGCDKLYSVLFPQYQFRAQSKARIAAWYLSWGLIFYSMYRTKSVMSQIQQGVVNIQITQETHTQDFKDVKHKQDQTRLELKIDIAKVGKKVDDLKTPLQNLETTLGTVQKDVLETKQAAERISDEMAPKKMLEKVLENTEKIIDAGLHTRKAILKSDLAHEKMFKSLLLAMDIYAACNTKKILEQQLTKK